MKIHQEGEWDDNGARSPQRPEGQAQAQGGKLHPPEMHSGHAHADKRAHVGARRDA